MKASRQIMIGALDLNKGGRSTYIQHLVVIPCGAEPREKYVNVARINCFRVGLRNVSRRWRIAECATSRRGKCPRGFRTEHNGPVASLQVARQRQRINSLESFFFA